MAVFWDVTPCSLVDIYQILEEPPAFMSTAKEQTLLPRTWRRRVANICHTTRRHIPRYPNFNTNLCENFESYIIIDRLPFTQFVINRFAIYDPYSYQSS
jgi:hypothetical protein